MQTLILTLIISLLAILGLALGTLVGRGPIKGSCGSLACKGLSCATCPSRKKEVAE